MPPPPPPLAAAPILPPGLTRATSTLPKSMPTSQQDTWAMALKLVLAIQSSLDALELQNATFLAELLVGYLPHSDDALYWLARCHFARGRPGAVIEILKAAQSVTARFLYARACIELARFDDAENALVEIVDADGVVHLRRQESPAEQGQYPLVEPPSNASQLALVGQMYQHTQRKQLACHCYERALAANPFLWTAYEQLCRLGGVTTNDMPPETFSPDKATAALVYLRDGRPCSLLFRGEGSATSCSTGSPTDQHAHPFPPTGRPVSAAPASSTSDVAAPPRTSENQKRPRSDTPGSSPVRLGGSGPAKVAATEEARAKRFQSRMPLSRLLHPNPAPSVESSAGADADTGRRPSEANTTTVGSDDSEMTGAGLEHASPTCALSAPATHVLATSVRLGLPSLMSTLATLALAHLALKQHKRAKARRLLHTRLTARLQSTALAHRLLALTYEHDTSFGAHVLTHLKRAHALAPWDPQGMDTYSSQLWLKWGKGQGAEAELSRVAQYLGVVVPQAPETLVALGNLASREDIEKGGGKDRAIELFRRAGQVQVGYAYGWALIGHEYRGMKKVDGAVDAFNRALSVDPDLVSAWSGLGYTYEDMHQHVLAMQCFHHAFELSGVPMYESHIGLSLLTQGKHAEAIAVLESAIKHNDKGSITKLALAKTYLGVDRPEPAMPLLEQVLVDSPLDSEIHYLIAYTHNLLGNKKAAIRALMDCQAYLAPETHGHVARALLDQLEGDVELELNEVMERVADAVEAAKERDGMSLGIGMGRVDDSLIL